VCFLSVFPIKTDKSSERWTNQSERLGGRACLIMKRQCFCTDFNKLLCVSLENGRSMFVAVSQHLIPLEWKILHAP
jgi:hypothetical protein